MKSQHKDYQVSCFLRFCFIYLLICTKVNAQQNDSIVIKRQDSLITGVGFALNFDGRTSLIEGKRVNIWGVNTGVILGQKRSQLTVGYYWMNYIPRFLDFRKNAVKRINPDFYLKTDLYYFNLMYWNNIINNKHWRLSIPLEVGIGATINENMNLSREIQVWKRKDYFIPLQAGAFLEWKVTKWFGLAVQGGYRYAIMQRDANKNYSGPYFSFGAVIYRKLLTDAYKRVFKKKKNKEISPNE